jgi:hypothetical protein
MVASLDLGQLEISVVPTVQRVAHRHRRMGFTTLGVSTVDIQNSSSSPCSSSDAGVAFQLGGRCEVATWFCGTTGG